MKCYDFKPDHNGECTNCDNWLDEHLRIETPSDYDAAIKALSELMFKDTDNPFIKDLAMALEAHEQKLLLAYVQQLEPTERRELLDIVKVMVRVRSKTR